MKIKTLITLIPILLFFETACAQSGDFSGKVIKIADGDTFTVLTEDMAQVRIRINGIDAPESKQAYGQKSRQWLADKIFGKTVQLTNTSQDRYGRTVATVILKDEDIGLSSILAGMAWHYSRFFESEQYAAAQREAQQERRGLWQDPNPINPYEYRKTNSHND